MARRCVPLVVLSILLSFFGTLSLHAASQGTRLQYANTSDTPDDIALHGLTMHMGMLYAEHPEAAVSYIANTTGITDSRSRGLLQYLVALRRDINSEAHRVAKRIACPSNSKRPEGEQQVTAALNAVDDAKEAVYSRHLSRARTELQPDLRQALDQLLSDFKPLVYYRKTDAKAEFQATGVNPDQALADYCERLERR